MKRSARYPFRVPKARFIGRRPASRVAAQLASCASARFIEKSTLARAFFCLKRDKRCLNKGNCEQKVSGYDYLFKILLILSSNDVFFFMLFFQIRFESSGVPLSRYEKKAKSKFSIGITPSKAKP